MEKINENMTFREVLEKYPHLAKIFLKYGLHCIGCPLASMETIKQGCLAHGLSEEQLQKLLEELNAALQAKE